MRLRDLLLGKVIVFVVVCHCMVVNGFGQVVIGKVITERLLAWTDFAGKADAISPYSALTNWKVSYRAHVDSFHGDTVFLSFRVTPAFNSYASWVKKERIRKKKEAEELLRHEQGHYDIAILCTETLRQALQTTLFLKSNYSSKADSIADATTAMFTQIEDQYDAETNHMLNRDEQRRWNQNIANLLSKVPNIYHKR